MKQVVIVGGGIAGLSAAYSLQKLAKESGSEMAITLLEAAKTMGGKIVTHRTNGFVIEGGPDTFLATKLWAVRLCNELGLGERLHGTNPEHRNTYVLRNGRLHPLPEGLTMMVPTRITPMLRTGLLSWAAKARMGMDFFLPPRSRNGDESLGEFVSRRLGRQVYENLIEPLMSGIYAGDGDALSLKATFPYLRDFELEHGGVVKGALAARKKLAQNSTSRDGNRSSKRSVFLTPETGLAEIVEALVSRLETGGATLRTGVRVRKLTASPSLASSMSASSMSAQDDRIKAPAGENLRFIVELDDEEQLVADAVILATPAYVSGDLLEESDPALASDLLSIPYVSTATVSLAYRQDDLPRPLDGYGYMIPRSEGRKALACTWTSTKFPHRAPEDFALLRVFIGRAGQEDSLLWKEPDLLEVAREEVRATLGIEAAPALARVFVWDRAMPQYNLGHPDRLKRIESAMARWPGLALAGNGYTGIGLPDCIRSGQEAAESVYKTALSLKRRDHLGDPYPREVVGKRQAKQDH
jgi:oxygen-dependent protoporphyrinogen oxidase